MRRKLSFALFLAVLTVLFAAPAMAGTVTLSTFYSALGTHSCGSSSSGAPLTETCGNNYAISPTVTGHFTGTGTASASTAGALTFHASSDLSAWVDNTTLTPGTLSPQYGASLVSSAVVADTVAVLNAGTAQSGFIRFVFDVTGSVTNRYDIVTLDGFNPDQGSSGFQGLASGNVTLNVNGVSQVFGTAGTRTLDIPYNFSAPGALTLTFRTQASGQIFTTYQGFRSNVDFANTAELVGTTILDANGNVIPGAGLGSESGFDYRTTGTPAAVPEPASFVLLTLGLFFLRLKRVKAAQ